MNFIQINKRKIFDYFIIIIRFLLAFIFITYGFSKLINEQFVLTNEMLEKPIKDLNLMQIGWYLFEKQPFKYFIGISQIICGILFLLNRTVLIGAIIFLPIALNILIIDITIMPTEMGNIFAKRLGFYIFLDLLIFYYYRKQTFEALKSLSKSVKPKYKHQIWILIFIPIFAFMLEFFPGIPNLVYAFITNPSKVILNIKEVINIIEKNFLK